MTRAIVILPGVAAAFSASSSCSVHAGEPRFVPHVIQPARPDAKDKMDEEPSIGADGVEGHAGCIES